MCVGDVVLAIGNPYDCGQTITQGIVSATSRKRRSIGAFTDDFIQTDVDINFGNSDGALINATGQLIGINTLIFSTTDGSQEIGLAIPINLVVGIMNALIENERVVRGWLCIVVQVFPSDATDPS